MRIAFFSAAALVLLACGGDDTTTTITGPDSGGSDTSSDQASGDGAKPDGGGGGDSSGGDGGVDANGFDANVPDANLACTDPSMCKNGEDCCGDIVLGQGNPPQCPINSITSSCGKCSTQLSFTCSTTEVVRLCAATADCKSDQANPKCCTFKQGMQSITFCTTAQIASFGGGVCL